MKPILTFFLISLATLSFSERFYICGYDSIQFHTNSSDAGVFDMNDTLLVTRADSIVLWYDYPGDDYGFVGDDIYEPCFNFFYNSTDTAHTITEDGYYLVTNAMNYPHSYFYVFFIDENDATIDIEKSMNGTDNSFNCSVSSLFDSVSWNGGLGDNLNYSFDAEGNYQVEVFSFCHDTFTTIFDLNMHDQKIITGRTAGDSLIYFNPDPDINMPIHPDGGWNSYDLDINGDSISDFLIYSSNSSTYAMGGHYNSSYIEPYNENKIALIRSLKKLKILEDSIVIDQDLHWSDQKTYLYKSNFNISDPFEGCGLSWGSSKYIGVQLKLDDNIHYGWIKISSGGGGTNIHSYAVEGFESDINEIESKPIEIYPNPVINKLSINSGDVIESVEVMDLTGKLIIKTNPMAFDHEVDVSYLESGIYIITLFIDGKKIQRKFIKTEA